MQALTRLTSVREIVRRTPRPRFRSRLRVVTLPKTFDQALSRGWKLVTEKSNLEADKRHRWGTVTLTLAGQPHRLSVSYTASILNGYEFGKPQLM
ncbi:MAG: hypothetical protein WBD87_08805 [Candidatus Acidiferrales bacterium]